MTLGKAPGTNQDELSGLALDVKKLEALSAERVRLMKLDVKYKGGSRGVKIKLEQNQDDINELESAINIKKSTKSTIEKGGLNFDISHPSFQRSYNNYLEAKKRGIRVQEHYDYIPTLKSENTQLDLSLPEIVLSETSIVKPEEPFLLESVAFEKTLSDYIGKNVHKKLISGYGKLENNPDALQKLDSYYTKFQEETYQNFKDINPSFDKNVFVRIFASSFVTWMEYAKSTVFIHENGHYITAKNLGMNPSLGYGDAHNEKNGITVYEQFMAVLLNKGGAHVNHQSKANLENDMSVIGNGVNINTLYANESYEKIISSDGGKMSFIKNISTNGNNLYLLGYILRNKTADDNDIDSYLTDMNTKNNTDFTVDDLQKYSLLTVLSGSTISGIIGGYDYIVGGKTESEILGFSTKYGKVYLPEFNTWLGEKGVSVELKQYFKTKSGNLYNFGTKVGVMGNDEQSLILGMRIKINDGEVNGSVSVGDNPGFDLGITKNIGNGVDLEGRLGYADNENIFHIPGGEGFSAEVKLNYRF